MSETMNPDLGPLKDPTRFTEKLNIEGESPEILRQELAMMLLIRRAEEKIGDMVTAKKIVCPCHLAIGQEACAVGVARHLTDSDRIFGTHRSHAHFLATGGKVTSLFAEVLGRFTGSSKGLGGSMHLYNEESGFKGSVPIVAGTVPLAVGAALAAQKDGKSPMDVGVCFFGDGAVEEGPVHESLNIASIYKLPTLFVCENNLFSSHLHIGLRQPADSVARFAQAHRLNVRVVDGNDVVAVAKATQELLNEARQGKGPGFLELVTYRWRGHVGPREDIDVGLKRGEELKVWKERDPVRRLKQALIGQNELSEEQFEEMDSEIKGKVEVAWEQAEMAPSPPAEALLSYVYKQEVHS